MEKALNDFNFDVDGLVVADIGSSTGGFTHCVLQRGAKSVYAIDLNDDLLHHSLKDNPKVKRIIKNARQLDVNDFDCKIDLITTDLSFISATYVLPVISNLLDDKKHLILLIKPQFESVEKVKFKNGIVKDSKKRVECCKRVFDCALEHGLTPIALTTAPIKKDKNVEYLMLCEKNSNKLLDFNSIIF